MTPHRRWFQFRFRLPYPLSLLSTCFSLTVLSIVLRSLRLTEGVWSTVAAIVSMHLLYDLVAGGHGMSIHLLGK